MRRSEYNFVKSPQGQNLGAFCVHVARPKPVFHKGTGLLLALSGHRCARRGMSALRDRVDIPIMAQMMPLMSTRPSWLSMIPHLRVVPLLGSM